MKGNDVKKAAVAVLALTVSVWALACPGKKCDCDKEKEHCEQAKSADEKGSKQKRCAEHASHEGHSQLEKLPATAAGAKASDMKAGEGRGCGQKIAAKSKLMELADSSSRETEPKGKVKCSDCD